MKIKQPLHPSMPYKYTRAFWIYLLSIHILLVIVILKSNLPERAAHHIGVSPFRQPPELGLHYLTMLDYHRSMDGLLPPKQTLFIGDSITQGLATSAVIEQSVNFGIGGDTTQGVLERLVNYTSLGRAKTIILAIGLNDFKHRSVQTITSNYLEILQKLPKDIPVMISAVLPVDERIDSVTVSNDAILELNNKLKKLAKQKSKYIYTDARHLLIDTSGNLKTMMHRGDGVHLSPQGYSLWISALQEGLEKLESNHHIEALSH